MKKIFFLIVFISYQLAIAQVGININANIDTKVSAQIQSDDNGVTKGILMPKYSLTDRDNLTYISGVLALTATDDGLIIYNTTEQCYNIWDGIKLQWKSLCPTNKATIIPDCGNISISGVFKQAVEINSTNTSVTIPVQVSVSGLYNFVVKRSVDNGYTFSSKLVYLTPTDTSVSLSAIGMPISPNQNEVFSIIIDNNIICNFTVSVQETPANYTLDCANIIVRGKYHVGRETTDNNYLIVPVTVNNVGYYTLSTPTINGLTFKAEGFFYETGLQYVFLAASGTPQDNIASSFTITSTPITAATNSCTVVVVSVLSGKNVLTFGGFSSFYGYGMTRSPYATNHVSLGYDLLTKGTAFGNSANSTFKIEPLVYGVNLLTGGAAVGGFTYIDEEVLKKFLLSTTPVDIAFFGERSELTTTAANLIFEFIQKKGVVLFFNEYTADDLLRLVLNTTTLTTTRPNDGTYLFKNHPGYPDIPANDPIVYGPFENLLGKAWGEDASATLQIRSTSIFDKNQIIAYTSNNFSGEINGFRHLTHNFLWFGDGGFASSCPDPNVTICPFRLTSTFLPATKQPYRGTTVYNSYVIANAFAWAFKQAEFNGIN